jgi:hypothetical protein
LRGRPLEIKVRKRLDSQRFLFRHYAYLRVRHIGPLWKLDDQTLIVCGKYMSPIRFILLVVLAAVPALASAETMNFEQAMAVLGASCGKDLDDNCRGVNLDSVRLKECLLRNADRISSKCQDDYPRAFRAIEQRVSARAALSKLCNWEMSHLCSEVRQDPVKGLHCLLESTKNTPNCNKAISAAGYR